jgi:sugar lactone lactonase YvrE
MGAKRLVATLGAAFGLLVSGSAVAMQDASPVPGPALPAGCSVVASGLVNPRYVAVAPDGTIYISESGTGGDEVLQMPAEPAASPEAGAAAATPVTDEGPGAGGTRGFTGQVTKIAPDGTQSVLASGLPSYLMGGVESTGPAGIAVAPDGSVVLAIGGSGPGAAFLDALPNENSVVRIDPATGEVTLLADIGAYERANNPEPTDIDSNLYGLDVGDDGTIYVNDAGGNTTYSVPAAGGEPTVLAVHPELPLPEGMQAPPGVTGLDPVPTGLAAVDGAVLVGYLSGGPFPPGAAKVVRVGLDGTISDVATGLTMVVDVETGPDGQLYTSQISTDFLVQPPAPGNVIRVQGDGSQQVVVDGLMLPNGVAFDAAGNLLVVVGAAAGPGNGMLLSCAGVAPAASSGESEVVVALNDVYFRAE